MNAEAKIKFLDVSKSYLQGELSIRAVAGLSFSVRIREFVCIIGPSGCGKSTLLNLAAGFLMPSSGSVRIDGREVAGPGTDRGMVFQTHNLFPWETVRGNIEFGPRMKGMSKDERNSVMRRNLEDVGLLDFASSYPHQLSMGMQQRVGLARAFANDPEILLMDEPFGSLDALTRLQMQELLMSIWEKHRKTVLFVTHDVEEALLLADRILILSSRPCSIVREVSISLPRPRKHLQLNNPGVIAVKEEILSLLADRCSSAIQ
ncbi:MAG: ABC transporter ATP-binding protein [bacterium]